MEDESHIYVKNIQVNRQIIELRGEHEKLIESEHRLKSWNADLKNEVDNRTKELEKINEQKTNNFINLVHETKTPLTLIKNYLDEYISKHGSAKELDVIKGGVDKLTADVINLFDIERFSKGLIYINIIRCLTLAAFFKIVFPFLSITAVSIKLIVQPHL